MKSKLYLSGLMLAASLFSCAGPAVEQEKKPEVPVVTTEKAPENTPSPKPTATAAPLSATATSLSPQQTGGKDVWAIRDGWAYQNGAKFFAIGVWGVPGFRPTRGKVENELPNIQKFEQTRSLFNMVFVQSGYEKTYMRDVTILAGWPKLKWRFRKGFAGPDRWRPDKNGDNILDYQEMMFIRQNLDSFFGGYIKKHIVNELHERFKSRSFVWQVADEPNTGFENWLWHPSILEEYQRAVKEIDPNSLTFVDLFGTIRGDRFAYEEHYKRRFGSLPSQLPRGYDSNNLEGDPDNLLSYIYAADGTPVYERRRGSNRLRPQARSTFRSKYYDNVYQTAAAYSQTADVLGVNCYADFAEYPEAAGIVVDAIRAACGNTTPIWLYFDGAAYAKPKGMSDSKYVELVKCQIYLSIVHGATGLVFWSREQTDPSHWSRIEALVREVIGNLNIVKSTVLESAVQGDVHFARYQLNSGAQYVIAVNSNKSSRREYRDEGGTRLALRPLEVRIVQTR